MPVEWPTPEAVEWPMVEWPMPVEWPEGEWATRAASEALDLPRREEAPAAALRRRAGHPGFLAAIPAMADPGVLLTATGTGTRTAASSVLASVSSPTPARAAGTETPTATITTITTVMVTDRITQRRITDRTAGNKQSTTPRATWCL